MAVEALALFGENAITMKGGGAMGVANWTIRRTEPLENGRDEYTYECTYQWLPHDGGDVKKVEFTLEHNYTDEATVLMAKFFAKAAELVKERHG